LGIVAQIYCGGLDALLAQDALGIGANAALIAVGRLEEAAGAGVPGSPHSGNDPQALVLLGRLDDAEKLKADTRLPRMLQLLVNGRLEEARERRTALGYSSTHHAPNNHGSSCPWFGQTLGAAVIDAAFGDTGALRTALEEGATQTNGWGGRYALVCAAALDPAKDAALSAMGWRTEAKAWLLVAQALRGELANDRGAALESWRAFKALPMIERLIGEGHSPSVDVEIIAAWRIAMLAQSPP
jgi:hypothetical protein